MKNNGIINENLFNMIDMGNQCCYNKNANTVRNTEQGDYRRRENENYKAGDLSR